MRDMLGEEGWQIPFTLLDYAYAKTISTETVLDKITKRETEI